MERGRRKKRPRIPKEQAEAMNLYMKSRLPTHDIAGKIGSSTRTVQRWIKKYGWKEIYKQGYDEELSKIKDDTDRLFYMMMHRVPKVVQLSQTVNPQK
jgi:uncharacterized protein YjcR